MSIKAEIINRVYEKRLSLFTQLLPRLPDRREIYLDPAIKQAIDGTRRKKSVDRRFGQTRALLEMFVRGDPIVARWEGKSVNALIALLPLPDERREDSPVWEFRIGDPRPGLRIFGIFARKDCFIGTHCYQREDLPDGDQWPYEIGLCKNAWKTLFPAYEPLTGSSIHDFISNARLPL